MPAHHNHATESVESLLEEFARTRDPDVRDRLVEAHVPLAARIAERYARRGEPRDELRQVALVGIMHALERFEPQRGIRFSTFATVTAVGAVRRHFRDFGWAVRVPRRLQEHALAVRHVSVDLAQELKHPPTITDIAERMGLPEAQVREALAADDLYRLASIDAPDGGGSRTVAPDANASLSFERVEQRLEVEDMLASLATRERAIVEMRFLGGLTQREIAHRMGISQMHVSRLLARSLAALRTRSQCPADDEAGESRATQVSPPSRSGNDTAWHSSCGSSRSSSSSRGSLPPSAAQCSTASC